jgi:hypothetical protein
MAYRYNSYTTRKIPYIRILIGIRIVELSKQPLSIACGGKEKNQILANISS